MWLRPRLRLSEMAVGEVQILLPVVRGDVVFARANVVGNEVADRVIDRRRLLHAEARFAEEPVDRLGVLRGEEFAFRIGPEILRRARDVDGARRDERDELVLVDRQLVRGVRIGRVARAEPMRE